MARTKIKISFIATVFNEEKTILDLLKSINTQTVQPDEIVIVDGGSGDKTLRILTEFEFKISKNKVKILTAKGNRSIGRNEAVKRSSGDVIVCTDAGCTLDKNWIKNIIKPFDDKSVDVVAGYYDSKPKNIFEKSLIPYVLVMKDRVDPDNFLPATRSMAFRKSIWKKVGGFDVELSNNEDYAFARNLKKINANIVFAENALVWWRPRENIAQAFNMFYRFALGDIEAGIFRPKAVLIVVRYVIGAVLLLMGALAQSIALMGLVVVLLVAYYAWSIQKNYKYVKNIKAFIYLPILQVISDIAIIIGTTIVFFRK